MFGIRGYAVLSFALDSQARLLDYLGNRVLRAFDTLLFEFAMQSRSPVVFQSLALAHLFDFSRDRELLLGGRAWHMLQPLIKRTARHFEHTTLGFDGPSIPMFLDELEP